MSGNSSLVLLADFDFFDLAKAIVPLIFLVIWVISQATAGKAKGQPARKAPPRARVRPADPQPDRPPGGDFSGEIEDFLRKAAQRREGQKPDAAEPARQQRPQQPVAQARREQPRQATPAPRKQLASPPVAQLAKPREKKPKRDITANVEEHLDTSRIGQRQITSLDQAPSIATHVSQVFDHTVGRLASRDLVSDAQTAVASSEVKRAAAEPVMFVSLLANPENLQQAVILNEILQRPEHRW